MSNVLPQDAQKEIWSFHRGRFILVGSLVLLGGACLVLLTLLPSIIATDLLGKGNVVLDESDLTSVQADTERSDMVRARLLIAQFFPTASSTAPGFEALTAALEARPQGAAVEEIKYTRGKPSTIILNGTADDRAAISAYRTALDEIPYFDNVAVPVGAFAGAEGGNFSITITGAF